MSARWIDCDPSANTRRGPSSSSIGKGTLHAGPKPLFGIRFVPGEEHLVVGHEEVGMAIAGQIDEAQIRVLPIEVGEIDEACGSVPSRHRRYGKRSPGSVPEVDQIEVTVSREIEQLLATAIERRQRRARRHPSSTAPNWPSPRLGL